MENNIIKRMEAMGNFLSNIIKQLDAHTEAGFMLDFTREVPTGSDFDRGKLYAQCRVGMQIASDCLRKVRNHINCELADVLKQQEGEQPKAF
jgi:hypothetical protein